MKICDIKIKDIILSGKGFDRFLISFPLENRAITESINKIGVLNSPILLKIPGNKYKVICGYKRTAALKKSGKKSVCAKVFDSGELGVKKAVLLSVLDNISRGLNPVEISNAISKLKEYSACGDDEISVILNIPPSKNIVDDYLKIQQLDPGSKHALAAGELTPAHAFILLGLEKNDRAKFAVLFTKIIKPNINETKEIIQYLRDLKIKFGRKSLADVLKIKAIKVILNNKKLNSREKTDQLRKALVALRYPLITKKESVFKEKAKQLGLPGGTQVSHSRYFEDDNLKFEFRVKNINDLKTILNKLSSETGQIEELLKYIKE